MKNRIRNTGAALLSLLCLVTLTSAFNVPKRSLNLSSQLAFLRTAVKPVQQHTPLTFADRVAYQRAIEEVYWRHRIWPRGGGERPDSKPSLDEVMPTAQLEKKVEDYLRNSQALEDYWQKPISAEQLKAEMERMARHTKQPEVLRELFEALGNDPFVIAECLARPALSQRLLTNFYAYDQRFHGDLKRRAEADLRMHNIVRQLKDSSGKYSEIELVRSDGSQGEENRGAEPGLRLNSREWDESVQRLVATFNKPRNGTQKAFGVQSADMSARSKNAAAEDYKSIPLEKLSSLQEDDGRYYATAVVKKGKDRLKLATVEWRKEPLESWKAKAESQLPKVMAAVTANYILPTISDGATGCTDDTWTTTSTANAPTGRDSHTAVWTGSEMIVWGGYNNGQLNTGGRYNPSTDTWTATSLINAPTARDDHAAVWTGSEMIVWGGFGDLNVLNTGGRYSPSTDSWTATSTTNAPAARDLPTAVWTGSEMIVWGGNDITGGRYNPNTDTWTATATANAPSGRSNNTAVWIGSEMIVWGGTGISGVLNTGGRYNPGTDSWTTTSTINVPAARYLHTAVWTGSEMIVWGGTDGSNSLNTGGRYKPDIDSWTTTSTINVPAARYLHTAVWTGSEMIVWGGSAAFLSFLGNGGRYDRSTESWTTTSTTNAPAARTNHTAIWTGSEMIVWGGDEQSGSTNTGGRYCAQPPNPPIPQSAVSRKIHGEAGTFDVSLPLTGNLGIECRSGGATNDYQMIITFMTTVTVDSASVSSGTGSVTSFNVSGPQVTVNLTGVTNVQRITVTLFNVNDGTHMGNAAVSMGVLVGDVNANAIVNASDVSLTKAQVGQIVSDSNFREDVNANGSISAADVAQVKANVGTALP